MDSMQSATFIKTVKWLYALEIDDSLEYFQTGFREYLETGRSAIQSRIEETYARGIQLNGRARQIEDHAEATALLDAFGLTQIYDGDWWQSVVSAFLRLIASDDGDAEQAESVQETLLLLDTFADRMQILVSCVGPLQQLVVPTSVMRLSDFDDVLTLEVLASDESEAPTIERLEAVLEATQELYTTMCRIHGAEEPKPLRVLNMSSESGYRFDFSGEDSIVVDVKKLLVDVWVRIRNQDTPHIKDFNRAIVTNLAPCQKIEERLASGDLTQEIAGQLRHQLSALAMKMFDHGVQIREIPDTDTVDNRQLMEEIRQRRLPAPGPVAEPEVPSAKPKAATKPKRTPKAKSTTPKTSAKKTAAKTSRTTKSAAAATATAKKGRATTRKRKAA